MVNRYSLYTPTRPSPDTLIFAAGMACNRFGHPHATEPSGVFADIAEVASARFNMVFVDVHGMGGDTVDIHVGTTVESQSIQIGLSLDEAIGSEAISGRRIFIGQSLGSLAILNYLHHSGGKGLSEVVMLAPPTYDAVQCRLALISMFRKNAGTYIDDQGIGELQYGNEQKIIVDEGYWRSIEQNSLSRYQPLLSRLSTAAIGLYASGDKYFPESQHYLEKLLPSASIVKINGASHAFKTAEMRTQVINALSNKLA